jgi:hypothetical protein
VGRLSRALRSSPTIARVISPARVAGDLGVALGGPSEFRGVEPGADAGEDRDVAIRRRIGRSPRGGGGLAGSAE